MILSLMGLIAGAPFNIANATSNAYQGSTGTPPLVFNSTAALPNVGANTLGDLALPKTILSNVDNLISSSGAVQTSPDNITLYNSEVALRLLGGLQPHDELLGKDRQVLSSWSFWGVQYLAGASWVPLNPVSNSLMLLGTNTTGTFLVRTMHVEAGNISGVFTIGYRATSAGPLKWVLQFQSAVSAQYRMVYDWKNLTETPVTSISAGSLNETYGATKYTLFWNDVPKSLATSTELSPYYFSLLVNLGTVNAGSELFVDPSIVATNVGYSATALGFQRHVFYEPTGGYYFVFYYNGSNVNYRTSRDGVVWSTSQQMPAGWQWTDTEASSAAVFDAGTQVFVAAGTSKLAGSQVVQTWTSSAYWIQGSISGPQISWGPINTLDTLGLTFSCGSPAPCVSMGVRDVNIGVNSNGNVAFSYNEFYTDTLTTTCNSTLAVRFSVQQWYVKRVDQRLSCDTIFQLGDLDILRSIVLPADSQGGFRVIYQYPSSYHGVISLFSNTVDVHDNLGSRQTVDTYGPSSDQFSAVSDSNYGNDLVYTGKPQGQSGSLGNITYAYCASACSSWGSYSTDLLSGNGSNPTLTLDLSSGFVYVFAWELGSIAMRSRAPSRAWFDGSLVFPIDNQPSLRYLGSTLASVSMNFNHIPLVWTEASGSQYNAMFASVPIETVWSPYAAPEDPWNGKGLAPYGQYFANLAEYVSPFDGMLTVMEADLSIPGRGLDLSVARVYTEPSSFLSGNPYNFEGPYGFHDTTFLNGWTADPGVTATTDGDILSLSGTTSTAGYTQIFGPGGPATNAFPYMVVKAKGAGTLVVQTGHSDGSTGDSMTMSLGANYGLYAIALTPGKVTSSISFRNQSVPGTNYIDYVEITRPSIIGNGWQFNYPWMSDSPSPQFIHLWNGEGYRIPQSFWSGSSATLENHQGEQFVLVRNTTGIFLLPSAGLSYRFDPAANDLTKIQDLLGNNITFTYDSTNRISSITDTVGRTIQFHYNSSLPMLVQSINQTTIGGASLRGIVFKYDDKFSLISVTDPLGRTTRYSYNAGGDSSSKPWLLTRVTYPTQWYDNYTYTSSTVGSTATTYRVSWQSVNATLGTQIRHFGYKYTTGPGDAITNSTIANYDGISPTPVAYTTYSFSYAGVTWNVSDASHNFVRGEQQRFGPLGTVVQDTILVSPTQGYTNYYHYDRWGNMIYKDLMINPSTSQYHETFNAYYNDGMPPGFRAVQESFSLLQGSGAENAWSVYNQYPSQSWIVKNGAFNGTDPTRGGAFNTNLAWLNMSNTNLSLQARVYVGNQYSTAPSAGIFARYAGSGLAKLSLDLVAAGGQPFVELINDQNGYGGHTTCPWTAVNGAWYTFNMTVHGSSSTGWVTKDGQTGACGPVTGPTPPSGTGFGLVVNGLSATYTNVTATTVSSGITTVGFSDSFINNASPTGQIHDLPAGTAELQNGAQSAPIETYHSYYSWGGMNQTRQLYNSLQGIRWISSSTRYDAYGNPSRFTDPQGNSTIYSYSSRYQYAYLTSKTQTLVPGNVQVTNSFSYNFTTGLEISKVDGNGYNTTYKYDILGRVIRVSYPTGDFESHSYNDQANYVNSTNENGWLTQQIYDGLGRLTATERFTSGTVYSRETYTYNYANQISTKTDPLGNKINFTYDALGRTTSVVEPNGNTTRTTYNDAASWIRNTDESGISTCDIYDRLGRLLSIYQNASSTCQTGIPTAYSYDEAGNLLTVETFNNGFQFTNYTYDNLNRLTKTTYPDQTSESYNYDGNGNVAQKTDRNGSSTTITYDSINRPYITVFNGNQSNYVYHGFDNNGNLLSLWNQYGTITYSYDSRNRVKSEEYFFTLSSASQDLFVNYTYSGETLSRIIYPDSLRLNYTYDALGRVTRAFTAGNSWSYATLYYYPTDQVKSITYGNNLYANYTDDSMSRPSKITLTKPGTPTTTLLSLSYNYTKTGTVSLVNGQVNRITENEQYTYDSLQRLTNATLLKGVTQTTLAYQYDSVGNKVWQKQNGAVATLAYNNANNELASSTSGSTNIHYSYDRNGNQLNQNITTGGTSHWIYKWDPAGYLDKVSNDNGVQGVYVYDGNHRLVASSEGVTTSFNGYLGTETLFQSIYGSSTTDYVFAGGTRIAKSTASTVNYYHADTEGSTRLVTSSTGSVLFADNYLPFGQDNGTPTGSETYKFTGKPVSATTGLYYDYQRWYDSSTGRFISRDPLPGALSDPQSQNGYVYVENLPTVLVDPTGAGPCLEGYLCQGGVGQVEDDNPDANDPVRERICGQNPFICGEGEGPRPAPSTEANTLPAPPTVTSSGGGDLPNILVDNTAASTDMVGSSGSLSNDIGNARQGETLFREVLDQGGDPLITEVEKTISIEGTGQTTRVDIYNPENGILESKGGYVSGSSPTSRYVIQAQKLALAGQQEGVQVRYYFYGGVSQPFKDVLRDLGISWWEA